MVMLLQSFRKSPKSGCLGAPVSSQFSIRGFQKRSFSWTQH